MDELSRGLRRILHPRTQKETRITKMGILILVLAHKIACEVFDS